MTSNKQLSIFQTLNMVRAILGLFILSNFTCVCTCNAQHIEPSNPLKKQLYQGKKLKIVVIDASGRRIQDASIVYLHHRIGTYSLQNGEAILPFFQDTLKITHVGYEDHMLYPRDTAEVIEMREIAYTLPSFTVSKRALSKNYVTLGFLKNSRSCLKDLYGGQVGFKLHSKQPVQGILASIKVGCIRTKNATQVKAELRMSDSENPNDGVVVWEKLITLSKGSKSLEINLEEEAIPFQSNKLFLLLTLLGPNNFKQGDYMHYKGQQVEPFILLTNESLDQLTYLNFWNRNSWKLHPIIPDPSGQPQTTNAIISFSVRYYKE